MQIVLNNKIIKGQAARQALDIFYKRHSWFVEKYGESGKKKSYEDWISHLSYLETALEVSDPELFTDYLAWCKVLFKSINFPLEHFTESLEILRDIFNEDNSQISKKAADYLERGLLAFAEMPSETGPFITGKSKINRLAKNYLDALLQMDRQKASKLISDALNNGTGIKDIYLNVFQSTQYEIGRLWQLNKITVAMEHFCTASTQLIISQLYPYILNGKKDGKKLVATSISGEMHELGIRMVSDFLEMEGWDTYYLGANTPSPGIVSTIRELNADVLAVSVTISYHIEKLNQLIKLVKQNNKQGKLKIIVGGYPFNKNQNLWKLVGADGFADNAISAVEMVKKMYR